MDNRFSAKKIALPVLLLASCGVSAQKILYSNSQYTLYDNKVVQGKNTAIVKSASEIQSDYQSTASQVFPRNISFKFSINEKDLEMKPGENHNIIIGNEHESPIIKYGTAHKSGAASAQKYLPENYKYTFRLDFSEVLKQFETQGYYTAYDGTRIAKKDFRSLCISGGSEPLSWDFVNLEEKKLQLSDADNDGIFEITLTLNPVAAGAQKNKTWKLSRDVSAKPSYTSKQPIVDALYNMATEEGLVNIEPDGTFRTGAKWAGVWTRDISYSILLAFASQQPDVAKTSLMKKVKRDRIVQDTGSGGAWPVSSDRTTWALAAWEVYKTTGDKAWLESSYAIIKNTLDDDYKTIYDQDTRLFRGESSFLDWREQTYPKWMSNTDIYASLNLGTNAVHYQAHKILVEMGKLLGYGNDVRVYDERAQNLKAAINKYLWMPEKGYYAQYLYGRSALLQSPRYEALGEALSVLFEIADEKKTAEIVSKSPITDYGASCIYPQIPQIPPYHNNAVWPFVQAYWNLAAAKAGNEAVLNHGLASIYRASGLFLTNYENFVADSGDFVGTEVNSEQMLWSMAGNLAMVQRVFMGMEFYDSWLYFRPVVPKAYDGDKTLKNFRYRNATLDITVKGYGKQLAAFYLDGKLSDEPFLPADISGKHSIVIQLDNQEFGGSANLVRNHFSTATPLVKLEKNSLRWEKVNGATEYIVYKDNTQLAKTRELSISIKTDGFAEYRVSALDEKGYEGFTSEPIMVHSAKDLQLFEIEKFASKLSLPYINFSGTGFVELSTSKNQELSLRINVAQDGEYLVDFRYSNGNGPLNTDNKCAIRSLTVNAEYAGVIVMPQRGSGEWSDWGFTNSKKLYLKKGENQLKISLEPWNSNMNVEQNAAMLDYCRVIRME